MVLPLLALFARETGATVAEASFVVGLFGLGGLLFNVPAGLLITRFGKRNVVIATTALEGVIAVVLGFSQAIWFTALFVFLLGAVHTVFFVSRLSFFRALVPNHSRGRALALIGGENRFGRFIGPIIGGFLTEAMGFRFVFFAFAVLMAISLIFVIRWVPKDDPLERVTTRGKSLQRMGRILKENSRVFATAGVSIIILQLLRTARQALLPLVGEAIGLQISQVGIVVGLMYFMELILFYPTGIMMDRFGRKATAIPALVLLAIGLGLLPLATSFTVLTVFALIAGFGNGLGSGLNMTLSTDYAPAENPGEFIGVWRFIVDAGTTGGPFLVGILATALSLTGAAFVVGMLGISGAFVLTVLVPEPLKHRD
jgi:MFS family permease